MPGVEGSKPDDTDLLGAPTYCVGFRDHGTLRRPAGRLQTHSDCESLLRQNPIGRSPAFTRTWLVFARSRVVPVHPNSIIACMCRLLLIPNLTMRDIWKSCKMAAMLADKSSRVEVVLQPYSKSLVVSVSPCANSRRSVHIRCLAVLSADGRKPGVKWLSRT
jgi:hypothetical protein